MSVRERLAELGIELLGYKPQAKYVGAVTAGDLVFVSGAGPSRPEGGFVTGKVGADLDVVAAAEAARLCIISALSALNNEIGDLDRVKRIVKLLGFVNSAPGFSQQPSVIDGASELLVSLFGENGWHARSAVGVAELPFIIAVEFEMVAQIA
jgi:enamine deaminase RidA (YjgF/YER057c/UK114 family)